MNFDPDNVPEFKMPTKMLDKVYELSGSHEVGKGLLLGYLTQDGSPIIFLKTNSKIVEMGLRKAMESYLAEMEEEGTTSLGMAGGLDDLDDDDEAKY